MELKHVEVKIGQNISLYAFDLDLNPVILVLKLDLDMLKMHQRTENEVTNSYDSKVIARTDRQTDRQTRLPHLQIVNALTFSRNQYPGQKNTLTLQLRSGLMRRIELCMKVCTKEFL